MRTALLRYTPSSRATGLRGDPVKHHGPGLPRQACGLSQSDAHTSHQKSGFTLIELSIVLVIIGLIVGGVLVGQDLIANAKNRSQASQITEYK